MYKLRVLLIIFFFNTNNLLAVENPQVVFQDNKIILNNGTVVLTLQDDQNFQLLTLANKKKTWSFSYDNNPIWQFSVKGTEGHLFTINSENSQYKGASLQEKKDTKLLLMTWEYPLTEDLIGKVFMTISISKKNSLTEWSIASELPEMWSVLDVNFPMIRLANTENSKLIMPSGWGVEYDLSKVQNTTFSNVYPSSRATVQLMSIYDNQNVFYFATHDPKASLKTFNAKVKNPTVELSNRITVSEEWNNDGRFELPWKVSIGISDKGWENAVINWYKPFTYETIWGKKTFDEKRYPEWLINSDLWLTGGHTDEKEYEVTEKAIDYFGNQTSFHWYYWHNSAFDTNYPEYLPAKEGFKSIVKLVQDKGSHIMPYINGRLWDTTTVSYNSKKGYLATVLKKDLSPVVEIYASKAPNAVICPSVDIWSDIMTNLTDKIQGNILGTDGVYFDQVASARALPCWNGNHNHSIGGGVFWSDSFRTIFKNVRTILKPDHIISTEQNAEPYLDMFDLFLMANYPQGDVYNPIPLYPLIYSDRALLFGFYIFNKNDISYRLKNALTLLWGAQLNGGRTSFVLSPGMKENAQFLSNLKTFRKGQHDILNGGSFIKEVTPLGDNPILAIPNWGSPSSAVRGALWKSKEGQHAVVFVNIDTVKHEISLPFLESRRVLQAGECVRIDLKESSINNVF